MEKTAVKMPRSRIEIQKLDRSCLDIITILKKLLLSELFYQKIITISVQTAAHAVRDFKLPAFSGIEIHYIFPSFISFH